MRKLIAILTSLTLLLSLTACGNKENTDHSQESGASITSSNQESVQSNVSSTTSEDNKSQSITASSKPNSSSSKTSSTSSTNSASNNSTSKPTYQKQPSSSSSITSSKPTSTTSSSASKPQKLTVSEDVTFYSIYYCTDEYNTFETNFYTEYWKMPYGKEDDGSFTRDGYVLLGYSFDPNGKGELIRPGHKYILPSEKSYQYLYCVWAKETNPADFKTVEHGASVYITSYNGSDKVVYIPRQIGGKIVRGIASGAFKNNKTLTEVHITSSILEVAPDAFASCENLKTVTLYDNLQTISDASFKNSPVKTVRICAAQKPRYANSYGVGIKYERLIKTQGQKRIIIVAGSSALYGIESEYMESLLKSGHQVVNFGTNANMSILFYLDAITPLLTKNDVVVFAPEQYGPFAYYTNGNPELPSATFQGLASCYNLFENIDVSKYTKVFDSFAQHCVQTSKMREKSWEDHDENVNHRGDHGTLSSAMNSPDFCKGSNGTFRFNETVIPAEFIKNLNRVITNATKTKAKILFSYPPHNKNNIEKDSNNEAAFDFYNNWISKTVKCTLISDIRDYIYTGQYFTNTDYHLNTVGRELNTKQLAEDLIKAGVGVK